MTYSFRYLFRLPARSYIGADEAELTLFPGPPRVYISTTDLDSPIKSERQLAVRGHGYESEEDAQAAGQKWSHWVQAGLARVGLAGDFGARTRPSDAYFNVALSAMEEEAGAPVRNDYLGLHTYSDDAKPVFAPAPDITMSKGYHTTWVQLLVDAARTCDIEFDYRRALAYDTYRSSFDQEVPEVRLVTLVTAIEMLIDPEPRDDQTKTLVDALLQKVSEADCPDSEKRSIEGSLKHLYSQSIDQAGRTLVSRLGDRRYWDQTPEEFFRTSYSFRSDLVHGNHPQPSRQYVQWCTVYLEQMVGHLLCGELIDAVSDEQIDQETERIRTRQQSEQS